MPIHLVAIRGHGYNTPNVEWGSVGYQVELRINPVLQNGNLLQTLRVDELSYTIIYTQHNEMPNYRFRMNRLVRDKPDGSFSFFLDHTEIVRDGECKYSLDVALFSDYKIVDSMSADEYANDLTKAMLGTWITMGEWLGIDTRLFRAADLQWPDPPKSAFLPRSVEGTVARPLRPMFGMAYDKTRKKKS